MTAARCCGRHLAGRRRPAAAGVVEAAVFPVDGDGQLLPRRPELLELADSTDADEATVGPDPGDMHRGARVRRLDHRAAPDVHGHVV